MLWTTRYRRCLEEAIHRQRGKKDQSALLKSKDGLQLASSPYLCQESDTYFEKGQSKRLASITRPKVIYVRLLFSINTRTAGYFSEMSPVWFKRKIGPDGHAQAYGETRISGNGE